MKTKLGFFLALMAVLAPPLVAAQVMMDDGGPCYSWEGGHKSAGSFSRCPQPMVIAKKPSPPPVVASPVMMPMAAPVQQTCAPPPKPVLRHYKPKPKPVCK